MKVLHKVISAVLICLCSAESVHAQVVINEVHWAGSDLSTADEWVELLNVATPSQSMAGWQLKSLGSDGGEKTIHTFGSGVVAVAGEPLLIANYPAAQSRLAREPDIVTAGMSLPNTKLRLRLYDGSGAVVDEVDDGIGVPFAGMNASGTGTRASMERIDPLVSGSLKENWRTATMALGWDEGAVCLGTPGFMNGASSEQRVASGEQQAGDGGQGASARSEQSSSSWQLTASSEQQAGEGISSFSSFQSSSPSYSSSSSVTIIIGITEPLPPPKAWQYLRINEILADPVGSDDSEWLELKNTSSGAVALGGLSVRTASGGKSYVFPEGEIFSGAYLHLPKTLTRLALRNAGDTVLLFSGSTLLHSLTYSEAQEGISTGLDNMEIVQLFCTPTPGKENVSTVTTPSIIVQQTSGTLVGSGVLVGLGHVSVNLTAAADSGSLVGGVCTWDFGDGFAPVSCNPPSHSIKTPGSFVVRLRFTDACGETAETTLGIEVQVPASKAGTSGAASSAHAPACVPDTWSDVRISEVLANPSLEEETGEWIELRNTGGQKANLCGWLLDDDSGGSKPYKLDALHMDPGGYLLLSRELTRIAANNDDDRIRLFAPGGTSQSGVLVSEVVLHKPGADEAIAWRDDGYFVATPYPTPGLPNRFRTAERRFPQDKVVVSGVLPNPAGTDDGFEWMELTNVSETTQSLDGWWLDNRSGGSLPFSLAGVSLQPMEVRRFLSATTGISLRNSQDSARLLDPEGFTASIISWTEAVDGRVYRPPVLSTVAASARVVRVVDGDTVDIALTNVDEFAKLPDALVRRWRAAAESDHPWLRIRLIGIDTPETVHPRKAVEQYGLEASRFTKQLLEGKNVRLHFDAELWDKYDRLLAYVSTEDGTLAQAQLLRSGLAYAYVRFPFAREAEFLAWQQEAQASKLGLWSSVEAEQFALEQQALAEDEAVLLTDGLSLDVSPASGLVASGTVVRLQSASAARVFVSVSSGAYIASSGVYVVSGPLSLRAYAEYVLPPDATQTGGVIRSPVVDAHYDVLQASYVLNFAVSEIYPSPKAGEEEWVELTFGASSKQQVASRNALLGWMVRDANGKPKVIQDVQLFGSGIVLLNTQKLGLSLNNDGDELWFASPDGAVGLHVTYGKVRKGESVVFGKRVAISDERKTDSGQSFHLTQDGLAADSGTMLMRSVYRNEEIVQLPFSLSPRRVYREAGLLQEKQASAQGRRTQTEDVAEEIVTAFSHQAVSCQSEIVTPGHENRCHVFTDETADADGDYVSDEREAWLYGTDPAKPDTDGDGWSDGFELAVGMNPLFSDIANRETEKLYKNFVLKMLQPKGKLLKTKGPVLELRRQPNAPSVTVWLDGRVVATEMQALKKVDQYRLAEAVSPGSHVFDVSLMDVTGRSFLLQNVFSFALAKPFMPKVHVVKARKTAKKKSGLALQTSAKLVAVAPWLEEEGDAFGSTIPENSLFAALRYSSFSPPVFALVRTTETQVLALFILLIFFLVLLPFFRFRNN